MKASDIARIPLAVRPSGVTKGYHHLSIGERSDADKNALNPYFIRNVVHESGERLPLRCRRSTGHPLFDPTCYAVAELRGSGRASATIEQALRAVMALHLVLDRLGVDLNVNRPGNRGSCLV